MRYCLTALCLSVILGLPAFSQQPPYAGAALEPHSKDPAVVKAEAAAEKLNKQLKAKPKDAALKQKVAEAYYQAGHALEYSTKIASPRTRYAGALKHYRKCLALNPKHAGAIREKDQIEGIYRSMGRPIPQ